MTKWNTAAYVRLSSDDGDNAESDSITNQRELINYFLKNESNFKIIDYYVDDGYSGTSFNRPAFKRMIEDVNNNCINAIYVKDLSRISRNVIDLLNFSEYKLKPKNVKLVSINENDDFLNIQKKIYRDFISKQKKIRRKCNGREKK